MNELLIRGAQIFVDGRSLGMSDDQIIRQAESMGRAAQTEAIKDFINRAR